MGEAGFISHRTVGGGGVGAAAQIGTVPATLFPSRPEPHTLIFEPVSGWRD